MCKRISVTILLCVSLLFHAQKIKGDDDHYIRSLHDKLITPNNPTIRPVKNSSHQLTVSLLFHLVSISQFDEAAQTVVANGFFTVMWVDQFLRWNSSEYGDVKEIRPNPYNVWRPSITVQNTVAALEPLGLDFSVVNVDSNGNVTWIPGETLKTFCKMDVTNFPFDEQTCSYTLFAWGYQLPLVDLQYINSAIDLSVYNANSEWDITNTNCYRTEVIYEASRNAFLHFTMTLKRKPALKVLTLILPVVLLNLLNVVVFLIPVETGEKLSFAITVLLSFTVFMSFISGMLPQSADSLSVLTVFLTAQFIMSSLYVLLSVWILNIYHRDSSISKYPPSWMTYLTKAMDNLSQKPSAVGDVVSSGNRKEAAWVKESSTDRPYTWMQISRAMDKIMFWFFITFFVLSTTITLLKISYF